MFLAPKGATGKGNMVFHRSLAQGDEICGIKSWEEFLKCHMPLKESIRMQNVPA